MMNSSAYSGVQNISNVEQLKPRIVQFKGERCCIRLEDEYWEVFEAEAKSKNRKFNELVHSYYNDPRGVQNKTAFMRRHAVRWLKRQVEHANKQLQLENSEIQSVLNVANEPAIIFSECQTISRYNEKFLSWLSDQISPADKKNIDYNTLRLSFRRSYNVLTGMIEENGGSVLGEQVAVLLPGYVFPVRMNVMRIHGRTENEQLFLGTMVEQIES